MYSTVKDFNQSSTVVPRTCPVRSGADSDIGVIYRPDFLPIRGGGQASLFLGSLEGWGGGGARSNGGGEAMPGAILPTPPFILMSGTGTGIDLK